MSPEYPSPPVTDARELVFHEDAFILTHSHSHVSSHVKAFRVAMVNDVAIAQTWQIDIVRDSVTGEQVTHSSHVALTDDQLRIMLDSLERLRREGRSAEATTV